MWSYRKYWKLIGAELGIDPSTLEAISNSHASIEDECLLDMIKDWLRNYGPCTRSAMKAVLQFVSKSGMYNINKFLT